MRKFIILFMILFPTFAWANDYQLRGTIYAWNNQKVYLLSFHGDQLNMIDSTISTNNGEFAFSIKEDLPSGLYRISLTEKKHFEIILNKEDIRLYTHVSDPFNQLTILQSEENKTYLKYIHKRNYDQYRIELLQPVLAYYPKDDPFYPKVLQEYTNIQDSLELYISNIKKEKKGSLAAKIIELDKRPKLNPVMTQTQQKEYAKVHFFDHKNFNDTSLLYTNSITKNILSYLSLYQNDKMNKDQTEASFIKAVDKILSVMRSNKLIYEYVTEYLIGGFERFGFNKVITYIASQIDAEEDCNNPELKHRIKTLQKLSIGNKAPEINFDGGSLYNIKKDYTLVLFYASWCPLCNELLPQISELYEDKKDKLEILAISVDTSQVDYNNYINEFNYPWIQKCDFKGWNTPSAIDYGIYVTPNLFLLDKNKKILGRPADIIELDILLSR